MADMDCVLLEPLQSYQWQTATLWHTWIASCLNHFSHTTDFKTCYPMTYTVCLLLEPLQPYQWLIWYEGWDLRASGGQPLGSSLSRRLSSNLWLQNLQPYDMHGLPPALTTSVIPLTSKLATLWQTWIVSCLNHFSHTTDFKTCYPMTYMDCLLLEPLQPYQWLIRYEGWDLRASGGQPLGSSLSRRLSSNQWLQNLQPYDMHGLPPALTTSVIPLTSKLATLWQTWIVSCLNHFSHTTDFKTCYPLTYTDCLLLEPLQPYQWLIRYKGWDLRASGGQPSGSSFSRRLSSNQWLPNLLRYDIRGLPPALTTSVIALTSKLATYGRHGLPPALATSAIPVTSKLATLWYQWIASCLNQFSHTNDFKACYSSGYKAVLELVGTVSVHGDRVR